MGRRSRARARAARKAEDNSRRWADRAAALRGAELVERVRESETVAKAQARGAELVDAARGRGAELAAVAGERGAELAAVARERGAELAAVAGERGSEAGRRARKRLKDSGLEERAAEVAARSGRAARKAQKALRESEAAQRAAERARQASDQALDRAGEWLAGSKAGERLGIERRRRSLPFWLALVIGAAVGYVVSRLLGRPGATAPLDEEFATSADRLVPAEGGDVAFPPTDAAAGAVVGSSVSTTGTATSELADRIRERLDADPRTTGLPSLSINVADTTVFVRGSVPAGADETAIREVVAGVPGVTDVDLQVTAGT